MASAISAQRAYFVGDNGLMLSTANAGASWTIHRLLDWGADPIYAVHFLNETTGIATGNNQGWRTTDGGITWSPLGFFQGSWSFLDFVDQNVGFAGANGACGKTNDGGITWTLQSGYPNCPVMFGMDFKDANVGLVGGLMAGSSAEGIFKTVDGGRTWMQKDDVPANDVVWMSSTRAIADERTTIRESLDAGETWHTIFWGLETGLVSMTRAGTGNVVLGVSMAGDVWRSADGGRNWVKTFDGPGALPDIWEISFADELHGWIVGPGGFFYYSSDGGLTWQQKNSGCTAQVYDIQMLDSSFGYAIGHNGYVFRTTNGGEFWGVQKLEVTGQIWGRDEGLVAVDIVDRDFAVTGGPGGTVFKTADGGETWQSIGYPNLSGGLYIYDVDFIDHSLGYVYGVNQGDDTKFLFRTRNGGLTWEWVNMGLIGGGTTIQFVDALYGWLTADNAFGWRTTDGGSTWTGFYMPTYFSGPEVSKVRFLNRNEGWAVGWDGYLAKTTNGGVNWQLVDLGTIEDHLFDVVPVSSSEIWLCGRENWSFAGVIYHSTNGGQSWSRQVVTDWFYYPYRMTALPTGEAWFGGYAGAIFKRDVPPVEVETSSFFFENGKRLSGGLAELLRSDDAYLVGLPFVKSGRAKDPIAFVVEGVAPFASPSTLEFSAETRATTILQLKIELWNFATGAWETLYGSQAPTGDMVRTVYAPAPCSQYVEPSTRKVRARLRWISNKDSARSWQAYIDQTVWRVRP